MDNLKEWIDHSHKADYEFKITSTYMIFFIIWWGGT
jgi:hypothetical protein